MVSYARVASLLSYCVIQCFAAVVLFFILEVPRAALPRDEIGSLAASVGNDSEVPWPRPTISVATSHAAMSDELHSFTQHLASALASEGVEVSVVVSTAASSLPGLHVCLVEEATSDTNRACLAAMEDVAASVVEGDGNMVSNGAFSLLLVPSANCSGLLLDAGTSAVLRWHRGGKGVEDLTELAKAVASRLRTTWFKELSLVNTSPLFEISPSYAFSFYLVSDCQRRAAWDFHKSLLAPYLRRFLSRLHNLFDFELDSQVVQCSSLGNAVSLRSFVQEVGVEALKADFLRNAGEWPGDTVTRDARWLPPLVRFAAFWPSDTFRVLDANGYPQRAFAVPGWGAVTLVGKGNAEPLCDAACMPPNNNSEDSTDKGHGPQHLSSCEAQRASSSWVSILRAWLTLQPEGPAGDTSTLCDGLPLHVAPPKLDGIAHWEQLLVARIVHSMFIRRAAETLQNVLALVDSLPDLEVREEIGDMVREAASSAQNSISEASAGNLTEALRAARRALQLALTTSHDDTVVAQMYFSWQFKWAVYLPLCLPIVVPTVVAAYREIVRVKKLRQLKLTQKAGEETVSEEVQ